MRKIIIFAAAMVCLLVSAVPSWSASVGDKAPNFTLKDLAGKERSLSSYKGKVILIDFWASWCPPCKRSIPEIDMLYKKYRDQGFVVLAVNVDKDRRNVVDFLKNIAPEITVLLDPEADVVGAYRILGMPSSMIIDRSGLIRYIHVSYTAETLTQYVLEIRPLLEEKK